jgi:hypothetical protein
MNVFACLVHEDPACVGDLVANLRFLDPESVVLLYDGSPGGVLRDDLVRFAGEGVLVHPAPAPMAWGRLHGFAVDCMRFAVERLEFDALTIVDSDQLALRPGYSEHLRSFLDGHQAAGCLASVPGPQPSTVRTGPALTAWREVGLWRPFLRRFADGERNFPHWTFWPSTVFTRRAVEDLLALWDDRQLQEILARSRIFATEEVVLPTLVALTGHEVLQNPCSHQLVRYRAAYTVSQVDAALTRPDVFWIHPVPRRYDHPLRRHVRERFGRYLPAARGSTEGPLQGSMPLPSAALPALDRLESVEGWLSRQEAALLAAAAGHALTALPPPHRIVEVGSYCGRATVVLGAVAKTVDPAATVHAVDPHDGLLGTRQQVVRAAAGSLQRLTDNLATAGVREVVEPIVGYAHQVRWDRPISLLVVDHLHDVASVAADFSHFEPWLVEGGLVAFHDYADYFPGVRAFVDQLLASDAYALVQRVETMVVARKARGLRLPRVHPILERLDGVEGWLDPDEAALLATAAAQALEQAPSAAIVEVGSYCGRGTVVLGSVVAAAGAPAEVHAVDTFDGVVGAAGAGLLRLAPTLDRFTRNVAAAGLSSVVRVRRGRSIEVPWDGPVGLLVVDGLHDYVSVAADFRRFEPSVVPGGLVGFHDCADCYPGVQAFVAEVLRHGRFERTAQAGSLVVLRKAGESTAPPDPGTVRRRLPLVSCVMPTYNRRAFLPQAIGYFLRQDYPERELLVVDDGTDPVEDLMPDDDRVRYLRLPRRRSIGAKRNIGCEHAAGELIVHWDDDDWMADWRLRYQVETFLEQDVDVSGLSTLLYCEVPGGKGWRYQYPAGRRPWVHDPTFCYRRALWASMPFPDLSHGIDVRYLWQGRAKRVGVLPDPSFYVGVVHPANTSRKRTGDAWWSPYPAEEIAALMGGDWSFYASVLAGTGPLAQVGATV